MASASLYQEYIPISSFTNVKSYDGYIVRFPMYVLGSDDLHVIFTETGTPTPNGSGLYEFGKVAVEAIREHPQISSAADAGGR